MYPQLFEMDHRTFTETCLSSQSLQLTFSSSFYLFPLGGRCSGSAHSQTLKHISISTFQILFSSRSLQPVAPEECAALQSLSISPMTNTSKQQVSSLDTSAMSDRKKNFTATTTSSTKANYDFSSSEGFGGNLLDCRNLNFVFVKDLKMLVRQKCVFSGKMIKMSLLVLKFADPCS